MDRSNNPTIKIRSAFSAALSIASASVSVRAKGVSQKTCLPRSSAATTNSAWIDVGKQTSMASTLGSSNNADTSPTAFASQIFAAASARSRFRLKMPTTLEPLIRG
jgi:hypothetical protein